MENDKDKDIIILTEEYPYKHPADKDPACGVNFFQNIPILRAIGKRLFLFGNDRACTLHDAEDVARELKEDGSLPPTENDNRFERGMMLEVKNSTLYSERGTGFDKLWDTQRAVLFPWIAKQYTKYFRKG